MTEPREVRFQPLMLNGVVILPSWAAIPMLLGGVLFAILGIAMLWSHRDAVDQLRRLEREVRVLEARHTDLERAIIAAGMVRPADLAGKQERSP